MPFESLKFRHAWRPYQQRVLEAIDDHLHDKRLHVVAAPGAGKTTLGLEVFRRLQKTAMVLSPTRVIRDQWIDRLADFIDSNDIDSNDVAGLPWVSTSILAPKTLTSITYQALHSQLRDELAAQDDEAEALELDDGVSDSDLDVFINTLRTNEIEVIILDEAHHLRAEWWRALDKVCKALPDPILVSLTATPPYGAQDHEWSRYEQLCGPIDEEISIPELVKAGTLCPHQDYIWAVDVSSTEKQQIDEYDDRVATLCDTLFAAREFDDIVRSHPWFEQDHPESEVIKSPELAIALLAFLKQKGHPLPQNLLTLLDLTRGDIPELGRHWWQVLVEAVLFSTTFQHSDAHRESVEQLKKQLRASELLHRRELSLECSRRLRRSLSQSASKVEACVAIHALEYRYRGDSLRQVVLVDYIRDEELVSGIDTGEVSLGAWPIFRGMATASGISDQIGLLTGRLTIIPSAVLPGFLARVDESRISYDTMAGNERYLKITGPLNQLTTAQTALLMSGELKTLVGTRALLGEGWDAPAINSLVLASSVGSFMLTNQMRGRAIRVDKSNPGKLSSIWHLLAIDSKSSYTGWSDYFELRKRFNTFVGLSEKTPTIESGFERMQARAFDRVITMSLISPVVANNQEMNRRFETLPNIGQRWQEALTLDESARVVPSVETPAVPSIRSYHLKHTLKNLLFQLAGAAGLATSIVLQGHPRTSSGLMISLAVVVGGAMLYKLPQAISAVTILMRHLPVEGSIRQIGLALREALCQAGFIETSIQRTEVNVTSGMDGGYYLSLSGSTFYESSLFADCLAETLAPIENPRYLVIRQGKLYGIERDDFHAVPMKLGAKKELAQIFYQAWCRYVGPTELIYTRNEAGRERLVKARMKAFSSTFARDIKRQDRWQSGV